MCAMAALAAKDKNEIKASKELAEEAIGLYKNASEVSGRNLEPMINTLKELFL